jgi:acetolactate synthase I/II/III large subunit
MRTGADVLWGQLVQEGVEVVFGYPGAAVLPIYDAMPRFPIRHVLCRHEQGAAHMADGYARASGRVGVAVATSGPGATNLTTGIANAMRDSIPTVFITGQVGSALLGSAAFQEVDTTAIARPITKAAWRIRTVDELAPALRRAFGLARMGRPGPVLIDICRDAQEAHCRFELERGASEPEPPRCGWSEADLVRALELIDRAERPLLLAGGGVIGGGASAVLSRFAELTGAPVALTLLGLGAFPSRHPLCLGMIGMHGQAHANHAIQRADLLIACGMRFDDRVTGRLASFAPKARKIHIDIDGAEIGRKVAVDVGLVGDVAEALTALGAQAAPKLRRSWLAEIGAWRRETAARDILGSAPDGRLHAPQVIDSLGRLTDGNAIVVTDVGQHQMWTAQYFPHQHPRHFITSGGLGTMGFGLPAAIGAKLARPDAEVWVISGDGGFQMTQCELATIAQERIDIKIAIVNNGFLGMVRQWQELFYDRRYTATPMLAPDFVTLARAYGLPAARVTAPEAVPDALRRARSTPGAALVEFCIEPEAIVYPMVPAGAALDEMLRRPFAKAAELEKVLPLLA